MKPIRPCSAAALLALTLLAVMAAPAMATQFDSGDRIHISNLHHITDDYVSWSEKLIIDGLVDGDVVSGAGDVTVNGTILGSANLFGAQVNHFGTVERSMRLFCQDGNIDGTVGGSIIAFANTITLGKPSDVARDITIFGSNITLQGNIGGKVLVKGKDVSISGHIVGDVDVRAGRVEIIAPAIIEGNFIYTSKHELFIDDTTGVTINGSVDWKTPTELGEDESEGVFTLANVALTIGKLLAAFIFGIILVVLSRRHAEAGFRSLRERLPTSLAAGVVTLLAFVGAVIALVLSLSMLIGGAILASSSSATAGALMFAVSLIGLPISSFLSVACGVLFYSGKIMGGFVIGYLIVCRGKPDCQPLAKGQLFLGLLILMVLFAIPYVGWIIYLFVSIVGMGALVLGIRRCQKAMVYFDDSQSPPSPPPPPIPPQSPSQPRQSPPPPTPPPSGSDQ